MDFFTRLLDTSDFPARWHCGNWSLALGWLHILSDLGVWSAYIAIPCVLSYFAVRRRDIPFRTIFWLFGAFILACGTTHLMEALIFWWPVYRLAGLIKLFTAAVSWATVAAMIPIVPKVLAMRSPEELEREVAARQQAELALARANTDLEQRVQQRTAELHETNEALRTSEERLQTVNAELREQNQRKGIFLATLAHELRNPLAPIRAGLQVLRLAPVEAEREQARGMMERQLGQLVRLVDDLLDVSRISRGKVLLRKAPIALRSIIENAVETARPLLDAKRHTLTVALPAEPVYVDADLTRLAQVFWNLLSNSAKYTDPGGRIELSASLANGDVEVRVRDNGIGFPAEARPSLFTMFSQVDHSLERAEGGLGIGLALVKGLVEMHGGTVSAQSDGAGRGSEFSVRLPTVPPEPQPSASGGEPRVPVARRRVLVVDDNRDAAALLTKMLTLDGHDTRAAHDGLEALELAESFRPEVVLLDIGMPKLNGYDAAMRIRKEPWGRQMVLVALTGWGQEDDKRRSREAGFDAHLVKPVDFALLEEILRRPAAAPRAAQGFESSGTSNPATG